MTHVHSQTVQSHLGGYLIAVVTDASENIRPERSHHVQRETVVARTVTADVWAGNKMGKIRVCAQCAHPELRIGSYIGRTGPDCGGFRGSGGNSSAGTWGDRGRQRTSSVNAHAAGSGEGEGARDLAPAEHEFSLNHARQDR